MRSEEAAVMLVAARQQGVVSLTQCLDAGMSRDRVFARVRSGHWCRVHRGVYAIGAAPLSELGRHLAATLAVGEAGALSHLSAAAHWNLRACPAGPPHVVSPTKRRRREDLAIHWTRDLPPADVCRRRGVRVTSLGRTLVDVADLLDLAAMEHALRAAERIHGFGRETLRPIHGRHGTPRLHGRAEVLRGELERLFLHRVLEAGLSRPELNVPWGPYELDALWRGPQVAVEIDDFETHRTRDAFDADRVRDRVLRVAGLQPVRVTHTDLTDRLQPMLAHLRALGVR